MPHFFISIIGLLTLLHCSVANAFQQRGGDEDLYQMELQAIAYKNHFIYQYHQDVFLLFDYLEAGTKDDFGMTLSLLKREDGLYKTIYQSRGSGDSYILKPTFYTGPSLQGAVLILAETGAEYSWGIRVFLVEPNLKVTDLGTLDVAVMPETEFMEGPVSAIPYTRVVAQTGGGYRFTFSRDVIFDPGGPNDKELRREEILYYYRDGILTLQLKQDAHTQKRPQ